MATMTASSIEDVRWPWRNPSGCPLTRKVLVVTVPAELAVLLEWVEIVITGHQQGGTPILQLWSSG